VAAGQAAGSLEGVSASPHFELQGDPRVLHHVQGARRAGILLSPEVFTEEDLGRLFDFFPGRLLDALSDAFLADVLLALLRLFPGTSLRTSRRLRRGVLPATAKGILAPKFFVAATLIPQPFPFRAASPTGEASPRVVTVVRIELVAAATFLHRLLLFLGSFLIVSSLNAPRSKAL
jgi:hypothetical protein